jgi:hypothetical protein
MGRIVFAPPDSYPLEPLDGLLVIARSAGADRASADKFDDTVGDHADEDSLGETLRMSMAASPPEGGNKGESKASIAHTWMEEDEEGAEEDAVVVLGWRPGASMALMLQVRERRCCLGTSRDTPYELPLSFSHLFCSYSCLGSR